MRRKNRKQKKVVVQAGKSKSGFEAEDEEEDVSKILTLGKHALIHVLYQITDGCRVRLRAGILVPLHSILKKKT